MQISVYAEGDRFAIFTSLEQLITLLLQTDCMSLPT